MTHIVSQTPRLLGTVRPPGDKSLAHRALIFGALSDCPVTVRRLPDGEDVRSTRDCLARLGADFVDLGPGAVRVRAPMRWSRGQHLDCGNSGTTTRLLAGVLAGLGIPTVLDGDPSLRRRPMRRVAGPLAELGADVSTGPDGRLPLQVGDPGHRLRGGHVVLAVASAQVKSAVLLAGLNAAGPVAVTEPALSRDHTERMLGGFGVELVRDGLTITLYPHEGRLQGRDLDLPGDISTAAFFLVAASIVPGSEVALQGVGINPTRTGLLDVLRVMGGRVDVLARGDVAGEPVADLHVASAPLRATVLRGDLIPRLIDEIPVIAVLATQAEGTTVVRDATELRFKESDRITATVRELRKLGADVRELEDGLEVTGPTPLTGARVRADGDHRLAMALAVAGLVADGETVIDGADVAAVSHPGIWDDLRRIGGRGVVRTGGGR
ncbi:3-phosphoshikimate 1-carboxyvinyltransferase [bacterium]|nr:3-phosphoshikimate 1-carboxyvinyltransferase [bacterium]